MISVAADDPERDPLEALAAAYIAGLRRGEHPAIAEYQAQYPDLAHEIGEYFPTIAALEGLREPSAGQLVGEYHLLREIGRGGMGAVFEAEQPSLQRRVAVKIMTASDGDALQRFQREARIAAGLIHPNILPVYACGENDGTAWMAMQLVKGCGLDRIISVLAEGRVTGFDDGFTDIVRALRERRPVPLGTRGPAHARAVARLGAEVAEALAHAHRAGVLHRDVKPANILLGEDGRLWVADFGLAKVIAERDATGTRLLAGTLRYTAPERFSGITDARSDLYALGVTLFELLTARPAFSGTGPGQIMAAISGPGVPDPARWAPTAPPAILRVIRRACAKDPALRQADALTLARELRAAADASDATILVALAPRGSRRWWYVLLAALGVAVVFAVLPLFAPPPRPTSEQSQAPEPPPLRPPPEAHPRDRRPPPEDQPPPPWAHDRRPPPERRPPP